MRAFRYVCVGLSALLLIAALTSAVVLFGRIETTTTVLAGASTAFAFLAYGLRMQERGRV